MNKIGFVYKNKVKRICNNGKLITVINVNEFLF